SWGTLSASGYGWLYLNQAGRFDTTSGLYNFRIRDDSPTMGRWMQSDPIKFLAEDPNLYRYLADDPVVHSDPLGLQYGGTGGWKPSQAKPHPNWVIIIGNQGGDGFDPNEYYEGWQGQTDWVFKVTTCPDKDTESRPIVSGWHQLAEKLKRVKCKCI